MVHSYNNSYRLGFQLIMYAHVHMCNGVGLPCICATKEKGGSQDYNTSSTALQTSSFYFLSQQSRLFVGLGFPFEGPAPLEAIAQGCVFLNPKVNPPVDRDSSDFFQRKPTNRQVQCVSLSLCIMCSSSHLVSWLSLLHTFIMNVVRRKNCPGGLAHAP